MRKKLSSLLLSVLVLGILAVPLNNLTLSNGHNTITLMGQWVDPTRG
ncbi:hypothetical protein [Clostridium sp. C8-1-8]|nr:hypothetical protein [Clostridium sp. C8-1-8]